MGFLKRFWNGYRPEAFFYACENGDEARAISMLNDKPKLAFAKDKKGVSALFYAVANDKLKTVDLILSITKRPDDIEPKDGFTPLLVAATHGNTELVRLLLKHGADPNIKTHNGITALHNAVYENQLEVVHILMDAQADPTIEDKIGNSAFDVAMEIGNQQIIEILGKRQLIVNHEGMDKISN